MTPQPEYILKLAERLVSAKRDVEAMQAEWDAIFNGIPQTSIPFKPAHPQKPTGVNNGVRKSIVEFLDSTPSEAFGAKEIARRFELNLGSARTTLSKLVKTGRIEKRGLGEYGAIRPSSAGSEKEASQEETS